MKVKAKRAGDFNYPQENGTIVGVSFQAGDKLNIPEQYFNPELFISLEPKLKKAE